jgi:PhnB protein
MQFVPYLSYDGNCREAFTFYEKLLGGQIVAMFTHGETPAAEHVGPESQDRIMHARLHVKDAVIMGGDGPVGMYETPRGFSISIQEDDPAEAERIFAALSAGGTVIMPMEETFWAKRFGMCTDRWGIPWMVNCEKPMG